MCFGCKLFLLLGVMALMFFCGCAIGSTYRFTIFCKHEWEVIAHDVCVGEGKLVTISKCKHCGKVKTD